VSQRALLIAVRDRIRDRLNYGPTECDVRPDGRPIAAASETYVAVHEGEWRGVDCEGLDELFGIDVTVSVRSGVTPDDRLGESLMVGPAGMSLDEKLRGIVALLHRDPPDYPVLNAANVLIGAGGNGLVVPLRFSHADRTKIADPKWFWGPPAEEDDCPAGLYRTLHFVEAERVQTIESQT
jgi:hypothetical protein